MMPSAAAPHSTASICRMMGVRRMLRRGNQLTMRLTKDLGRPRLLVSSFGEGLSIHSREVLEQGYHQIEGTLPACCDLGPRQRSAREMNVRPVANGPSIAGCSGSVFIECNPRGVGCTVMRET